ncbi:VWA domain-containing protein [Streptomyces sp. NBC_00264]|uniref:vWA domain-containing protein n=1 Tax=unclassified Streptomyces TaxID=2593676 RepID=UPI002253E8B4|nr:MULTISPECIES: VWA domain-containing protein [unclassified Streptomyces]MCX4396601.1 VWA domain-containing protein [Streptomyces sp. NBC_01767]MCX5100751.1 VWA domain-containing protein [Streptomyces sp. NBC_00439]MCX5160272.1 VWA domain-containing protein [Streptomyces sp. NBC_00305]MCX5218795.1 VWA domain-containing protein [Streptomyces sp. NBC_00264]WSP49037.1 VWA domain-containing protein [Streptomyces sp. NBC_01243]
MANFSKSNVPQFSVEVYQNEYLPEGGREVNAIVTVTSTGGGTTGGVPLSGAAASPAHVPGQAPNAAVVIMVDCSGSMDYPPTKMRNARDATAAAIDTLRDGTSFAVVGGTHVAKEVYPGNGRLAVADAQTRAQAKGALRALSAGGGTAIGTWLRLADRLLGAADVQIRHGILLTDGRNEHEAPEDLRAALESCAGRFTCDARGVGTDWEVKEVTAIASALLGTADIVADPAGLAADFTRMMENAMGKEVADVALRLWTPVGVEIKFVKQVAPTVVDLTGRRTEAGPRAGDYPTGSWGDESRDYHVCVTVPQAGIGQEMLASRVSLILPDPSGGAPQTLSQGLVRAVWTEDMVASTSINPQVAHYTGQVELAQVIQQGLDARKSGDFDGATAKLGRAVQLAAVSGNEDTAKLLSKVVDVVDAATGTVRLKAKVADADEMTLETRSTKTVRVKK